MSTPTVILLLRGASRLPLRLSRLIGAGLGSLLYVLGRKRRKVALTNLRLCFPEWSEAERRRVAQRHFRCFAQSFVDRGVLWYAAPDHIPEFVRSIDGHILDDTLASGRAVIVLGPHFIGMDACWIRLSMDRQYVSMYASQKNPDLDAAVLKARSRFTQPIPLTRQDGIRGAVRALKRGVPFYYLPDMDFGPRDAVFVPFFGVPAATITGVARIAALTQAVVIPCITRMTDEGYEMRFHPPWHDYPGKDIPAATRRMNAFIEDQVRLMPEQYLWVHKRFKTRPPGEPGVYDV